MVCPNDFERFWKPLEVVPYIRSLCKEDGMYGDDIDGTTLTVGFEAMMSAPDLPLLLLPLFITSIRLTQELSYPPALLKAQYMYTTQPADLT